MIRRAAAVACVATGLLWAAPGTASADVIFDPADADELAGTLAEAYEAQRVCYGWEISVDDEVNGLSQSVGSNFGAGNSILGAAQPDCKATVVLQANVSWTAETSESEDSATYSIYSSDPNGPTTDDLDDLDVISTDGLVGETVDVDVYKAVAALPLLAADKGIAEPIAATPAADTAPGDAQATNSPGSDFWRDSGMLILWGSLILLAGVAFAVFAIKAPRQFAPTRRHVEPVPPYVPPEWGPPPDSDDTGQNPPDAGRPPTTS